MSTFEVEGTYRTDIAFSEVVNADDRDEAEQMVRDKLMEDNDAAPVASIDIESIKEVKNG